MEQKSIVIFGAGKIGRSFIGQLFSRGGYQVVFIDQDENIIRSLNREKKYHIEIKDKKEETLLIEKVSGLHFSEKENIFRSLVNTNLAAVCVGNAGLPDVAKVIAGSLKEREKQSIHDPLDLILAENLRNAREVFADYLSAYLPPGFSITDRIGLVETSIGKMVPIMPSGIASSDPLLVYAEAYNDLIVDAKGFKNIIPEIKGLSPKENMKAWVDRKLFIHNLGHAASAYFGNYYYPGKKYIWEVLDIPDIYSKVRSAMDQAGSALQRLYPGEFSEKQIREHIEDLLERFQNRSLGDTVFRVGCDLKRKMNYDDRLAAPLRAAYENKLPFSSILSALICGCSFDARDEGGKSLDDDIKFVAGYKKHGISFVLENYCYLDPLKFKGIYNEAEKLKL